MLNSLALTPHSWRSGGHLTSKQVYTVLLWQSLVFVDLALTLKGQSKCSWIRYHRRLCGSQTAAGHYNGPESSQITAIKDLHLVSVPQRFLQQWINSIHHCSSFSAMRNGDGSAKNGLKLLVSNVSEAETASSGLIADLILSCTQVSRGWVSARHEPRLNKTSLKKCWPSACILNILKPILRGNWLFNCVFLWCRSHSLEAATGFSAGTLAK